MMQKAHYYACILLILISMRVSAQTQSEKLSVFIEITDFSDSTVSLDWSSHNSWTTTLSRKKISDIHWTPLVTNYSGTSYTDSTVVANTEYEYQFIVTNTDNLQEAFGYIAYGSKIAPKLNRGNLLIVVDDRFTLALEQEILTLQRDVISDGYTPLLLSVSKNESVTSVKTKIDAVHATDALAGLYLIGHIPVPKAGAIAPDGHGDHRGAWSTDLYYASNSNHWTDNQTNYINSFDTAMSNVPGDGKFDNYRILSQLICPISRVDFYDLPSQDNSELQMLKNYLNEASKYKHGEIRVKEAGLIDNQLVNFHEGFAGNGFRNFKSLMGDSITEGNMLNHLENDTYKWTYTASFGSDTSIHNVASISQLKNSSYRGIFSMVMGSYFGNWDKKNNIMRSLLADGKMLTTCWAGRPNWFFHHMGLNNPIGLSAKMSAENGTGRSPLNTSEYDAVGIGQNQVHISLLGDLTLRQNHLPSISDLSATHITTEQKTKLTWTAPSSGNGSVQLYRSSASADGYNLLATLPATDTLYVDSGIQQIYYYYIKHIQLDSTLSGSYYNNSVGTFIQVDTAAGLGTIDAVPAELISFSVRKQNDFGNIEWTTATEQNVSHFELQRSSDALNWETIRIENAVGNSTITQHYNYQDKNLLDGLNYYRLKTVDFDGYTEVSTPQVLNNRQDRKVIIYPNPSTNSEVHFTTGRQLTPQEYATIQVSDLRGNNVPYTLEQNTNKLRIDARKGTYFIKILDRAYRIILI